MADQTLAETGALEGPTAPQEVPEYTLRYKFTGRLRVWWVWARYLLAGRRRGIPGLVCFVLENYFFKAIQIPGELTALGEILAELRPERAVEIGTARGGTLLFL